MSIREIKKASNYCTFAQGCPLRAAGGNQQNEPVSAVYLLITKAGEIVRGLKGVKPAHLDLISFELAKLEAEVHRFHNEYTKKTKQAKKPYLNVV
jgi:hypothetical protein